MALITDSMVLIHLAKVSLLEKSCDYFKKIIIAESICKEILKGKEKGMPDVPVITKLIKDKKILIKKVKNKNLIKKANQFNVQRGEAEAVALYWQEKAALIATDDDNVRKKRTLLDIGVIGTPAIILRLFKENVIDKNKMKQCASELKKIGWFSSTILDKMLMEAE